MMITLASSINNFFDDNWLSVLIAFIVAIFGGGGLTALIKSRSEGSKIVVEAAQGAVVVQSGVIESLRIELNDLRAQITEIYSLRSRVRDLEHMNEILRAENTKMESQIRILQLKSDGGFNAVQVREAEKILMDSSSSDSSKMG